MTLTRASSSTFTPRSDAPAAESWAAASPAPTSRALARNPAAASLDSSASTSSMTV